MDEATMTDRTVVRQLRGIPANDGAGVRLTRIIGSPELPDLDPFLLLDEFRSDQPGDYIAGFPDHPHRGFETVTYLLAGRMRHRDNKGHAGLLSPGSVQWMTAGRGIVHSEMPEQEDGLLWGFQLWINLPASAKMTAPRYQEIGPSEIPELTLCPGVRARLVAGALTGARAPIEAAATEPLYLDLHLGAGARATIPVPAKHAAFAYVYDGVAEIAGSEIGRSTLAVLGTGDGVRLGSKKEGARLLLIAGKPLHEPIARYGPFVMNSEAELHQAFGDYQAGRL